jgi:hypothetical protein
MSKTTWFCFYNLLLQSCRVNVITGLIPCFSVYFSARNTKRSGELTVRNQAIIKLNTCTCLNFMYFTRKILPSNQEQIDNLVFSPDTSTLSKANCADWLDCSQEASGLKKQLIVCVLPETEWLVPNVTTRILIRTYKFRTANKTPPPLRIFVSRNRWHPLTELWNSRKTDLG